jgi:dsDNA-specific endonuclease/ATPase MutS2
MTEPVTPETQQPAPEAPPQQPEQQDANTLPQWARDAITKANKEAAGYRTKLAEVQPMADQFRQLEEASKSELQRIQEAQAAAEKRAEQAAAEAIRYKAAATHGIPADHFDLLGSGTEEEITARAEKISTLLAAQAQQQTPPPKPQSRPVEHMRPGATPGEADNEEDAIFARLFGAK